MQKKLNILIVANGYRDAVVFKIKPLFYLRIANTPTSIDEFQYRHYVWLMLWHQKADFDVAQCQIRFTE